VLIGRCGEESVVAWSFAQEKAGWRRTLRFGGLEWGVKTSHGSRCGPGPNVFADDPRNAWIDEGGRVHLKISHRDGALQCAEIAALQPLGHGTYTFHLETSPVFDQNAVLGLFLYADDHNEIDIELSSFGGAVLPYNAQFIVQPLDVNVPGFVSRFWLEPAWVRTRHSITWEASCVAFRSARLISRDAGVPESLIAEGITTIQVPAAMHMRPRINLWLYAGGEAEGSPPADAQEVDVVVSDFTFECSVDQQNDAQP
jgi:hypothetical protein